MARNAPQDEQIGQLINHIDGLELTGDPDRQAFMGELVGAFAGRQFMVANVGVGSKPAFWPPHSRVRYAPNNDLTAALR